MKMRILVLEDSSTAQEAIVSLIESLEKKANYAHIELEFTISIAAFKNLFSFKSYRGVILDDKVLDGNAFSSGLPKWVRKKDSRVGIGLNSSDHYEDLAREIDGSDLAKDPMAIKSFLMRLKNEI